MKYNQTAGAGWLRSHKNSSNTAQNAITAQPNSSRQPEENNLLWKCGRSVPRTSRTLTREREGEREIDQRHSHKKYINEWMRATEQHSSAYTPKTIYAVLNKWTTMLNMIRAHCMRLFQRFVFPVFSPFVRGSSTKWNAFASFLSSIPIQQFIAVRFSINFFLLTLSLSRSELLSWRVPRWLHLFLVRGRYYCKIISPNGQWRKYR